MTRFGFNMVKDGDRTVIVLNGTTPEKDELIWKILNAYCELESPGKSDTVPDAPTDKPIPVVSDMEPVESDVEDVPDSNALPSYETLREAGKEISSGPYKGMTAQQALAQDKSKALAELFKYSYYLPTSEERSEIVLSCKQFMDNLPNMAGYYNTRERIADFAKDMSVMMKIGPFIAGYPDLDSFIASATDEEMSNLFLAIAKTMQDRSRMDKQKAV